MKYITKFDYDNACGYQVRAPEVRGGKYIKYNAENRFFKRSAYKSWKACLAAAVKWRDKKLGRAKDRVLSERLSGKFGRPMVETGSRNTSGVIGVSISTTVKPSGEYYAYIAQWSETVDGQRTSRGKQFGMSSHGECEAFRLACEVRYEHCGVIIIKDENEIPCLPTVPYEVRE